MLTNPDPPESATPIPKPTRPAAWPESGLIILGFSALMVAVAELLFKRGAMATAQEPAALALFGISVLTSGWTWLGILAYIASFVSYLHVLRRMPLHLAFALMGTVQVLVPLGAWWFLSESIGPRRWCGILVVLAGVLVIAQPAMKAEEEL